MRRPGRLEFRPGICDEGEAPAGGSRRPPRGTPRGRNVLRRSDRVQYLSAVYQRILRLERVGEPVELLEPGISIVLAVLGVAGNLDGDDVLWRFRHAGRC